MSRALAAPTVVRACRLIEADARFVRIAKVESRPQSKVLRRVRRIGVTVRRGVGRWGSRAIILLLAVLAMAIIAVGSNPQPAKAGLYNDLAEAVTVVCDRKEGAVEDAGSGVEGFFSGPGKREGEMEKRLGPYPMTMWGQYGMAGTFWKTWGQDCWGGVPNMLMTGIADLVFYIPRMVAGLTIYFFQWTFTGQVLDAFLVQQPGKPDSLVGIVITELSISLYLQLFALVVIIAALVLFWQAIIKGAGLADILGKFIVMVLIGASLFVFSNHGTYFLSKLNAATNGITDTMFKAFAIPSCKVSADIDPNECEASGEAGSAVGSGRMSVPCVSGFPNLTYSGFTSKPDFTNGVTGIITGKEKKEVELNKVVPAHPNDCIAAILYSSLIGAPWRAGVSGQDSEPPPIGAMPEGVTVMSRKEFGFRVLAAQAQPRPSSPLRGIFPEKDIPHLLGIANISEKMGAVQFDDYVERWNERGIGIPESVRATLPPGELEAREEAARQLSKIPAFAAKAAAKPEEIRADLNAGNFNNILYAPDYDQLVAAVPVGNQEYFRLWSGGDSGKRISTALLSFLAVLLMSLVLFIISLAYLTLEISSIVFAILAPLALLIGIIPGFGTKIFLKWLELFLGTFLKRIGLAVFVGLISVFFSAVLSL